MTCDKCGRNMDDECFHTDINSLTYVAECSGWQYIHHKGWFCPDHWEHDDDDNLVVKD